MVISFAVEEARTQLEEKGLVYTLRPYIRFRIGKDWYNHFRGDTKKGDVFISFIGDFHRKDDDLERYVKDSGFVSLKKWLKKAKKSRYLYKVMLF